MPTFATPGPITATVTVAGAQVRVAASDRTDTVVLVEPIDKASQSDVKVASRTKVDFADGQLTVKTTVSGDKNGSVAITIDLPAGSSLVAYLAHSSVHADGPLGECELHMASGQAQLDRINALQANISAGEVTVGAIAGRASHRKQGRPDPDRARLGRPRTQQWQRGLRHRPRRRQRHRHDSRRRDPDRPAGTRPGGADERLRKHRDRHQRGHRGPGGRQQRAGIGTQLRTGAGRPRHARQPRQQGCRARPHAARRHHHSARRRLTSAS